jgi:hypothetical protein
VTDPFTYLEDLTMPKFITIECWVAVNESGDYECGQSREEAAERLQDGHGGEGEARRVICCTLTVPVPETVNLRAEIPVEADTAELRVD